VEAKDGQPSDVVRVDNVLEERGIELSTWQAGMAYGRRWFISSFPSTISAVNLWAGSKAHEDGKSLGWLNDCLPLSIVVSRP